jgi:hypothetical protein
MNFVMNFLLMPISLSSDSSSERQIDSRERSPPKERTRPATLAAVESTSFSLPAPKVAT